MICTMMSGVSYNLTGSVNVTSSSSSLLSNSPNSNCSVESPPNIRSNPKECGVCGDVAKSMHFGGLSCDSCKAFFRRSVQNNAYKGFTCPYEQNCNIGISSRKACQFCRFEKCLSIGMEKGWVMTEDERRRMMEQRKEKKVRQSHELGELPDQSLYKLSEEDRSEISRILSLYKRARNTIPYDEETENSHGTSFASAQAAPEQDRNLLTTWMTFCKRLAYFFSLFKDFTELSPGDQSLLLKTALTSAGIIMGAVVYDNNNGRWAGKTNGSCTYGNIPSVSPNSVEKLVPSDLICRVDKFFRKFQQICPDETMAMILILVSLYSPELMGLEAREKVQHIQERYIHILQNYVRYKFKEKSSVMFPKAIVSLADIRELADRTGQMRIQNRPASMFSSLLQNCGASASLSSPYSDLSLNTNMNSVPNEIFPSQPISPAGPENDPIYQRIVKVIYQMHASSLNARTPTLLPLIIQILKKWAHNHQDTKISGSRALMASARKSHRHSKPSRAHRSSSHRSKRLGIKKESLFSEVLPVVIKEEVMEHEDSNDSVWSPNAPREHLNDHCILSSSDQSFSSQIYHQQNNDQSQHFVSSQATGVLPQPTSASTLTQQQLNHGWHYSSPGSHLFSNESQLSSSHSQIYPSNGGSLQYPSNEGSPLVSYPLAVTPENGHPSLNVQHPLHQQHSSHLSSHLLPPYAPNQSNNSSSPSLTQGHFGETIIHSDSSSSTYALSPYSSSSSSSSPEDSNVEKNGVGNILHDDFTDAEVDVIMQLMERVSNFELLEKGGDGCSSSASSLHSSSSSNVTDILPLPLLKELQAKLSSLNSSANEVSSELLSQEVPFSSSYSSSLIDNDRVGTERVVLHLNDESTGMTAMEMTSPLPNPSNIPTLNNPISLPSLSTSLSSEIMEVDHNFSRS